MYCREIVHVPLSHIERIVRVEGAMQMKVLIGTKVKRKII